MPRKAKDMSALAVRRLEHPGGATHHTVAVGGVSGLLIQITPNDSKSWTLRTTIGGKRHEIGLGPYPEVTLQAARDKARFIKDEVRQGVDPLQSRREARAALETARRRSLTFADAVNRFLEAKDDGNGNAKHRRQWRSTLETYANPVLGRMPVDAITPQDVLQVIEPIWRTKTETASRLRGRIESVLSWATVAGHRTGDNPARWGGNLKELLPAPVKSRVVHQPALRLDDAARWFADLRERDGIGSRALEFAALTAARSGEVRGAVWSEIDLEKGLWIIPPGRMKMNREHRAPLSDAAVDLLRGLPRFQGTDLVFPAPRGGKISDMTLSATMQRMHAADFKRGGVGYPDRSSGRPAVPHGLRSTFRDWAAERTNHEGALAEMALAHHVGGAVELAYRRGDQLEKRRRMMDAWSGFLAGESGASVVALAR